MELQAASLPHSIAQNAIEWGTLGFTWATRQDCPGIAVGHFYNTQSVSYAVLLVPTNHPDTAYRFVIFSKKPNQPAYEGKHIDSADQIAAGNYFIHRAAISKFVDEVSRKKFQAHAPEGILLVDAAEKEYEVELYSWTPTGYRHEPIDY